MPTYSAADEPGVLSLATSIARGDEVDWDEADRTTSDGTLVGELRVIERVARLGDRIPDTWGRLTIAGELGRGSHGTVYRAHDPHLGIDVALKVVRPDGPGGGAIVARALNEARMLAQINHRNVVRVFWAEPLSNEVGVAMELVNGQTLREIVRQRFPLSVREVLTIGLDVCHALAAVHGQRMLHGDIKAGNVMRTAEGRTVLMDFGVGQDLKVDDGPAGLRTAGTPLYLAPELFEGAPRSPQADIYSAGVLLYHLATDAYPIDAHDAIAVERHHAERRPLRPIRELRPELPSAFVKVVERALARRPEDRYQTAVAFGDALEQALNGRSKVPLWRAAVGAATAALVAVTAYLGWPGTTPRGVELGTVATTAAPPAPVPAADSYRIDAAFYRLDGKTDVRLTPGARVAKDDELTLRIQSSVPVYAYVVNEDDRGESYLLFPLPDQQLTNPLPAGTRHEIPGIVNGEQVRWRVSSAGGREHFLIFVTPDEPLPGFERMFASLPRPRFGEPVIAQAMPHELVGALRGVGGLSRAAPAGASARLADQFAVPLAEREEIARGVWVRQLTLENPVR
jgi:eukaryotic-like serine/threonine-protein kinase